MPGAGNPQALNRFAYGNNNPVSFTDPSGHVAWFVSGAIGAAAGAVAAGALYYAFNSQSFDTTEFWTVVGSGALAGGLIGSGVGLLNGGAVTGALATVANTAINVGAGAAGAGTGYILSNPDGFDTTAFAVNTIGGGVTGGVSGALPAQGGGLLAKGVVNQVSAVLQYGAQQYAKHEPITDEGFANSVVAGTVAGLVDMAASSAAAGMATKFHPRSWLAPNNDQLLAYATRQAGGEGVVAAGLFVAGGTISTYLGAQLPPLRLSPQQEVNPQ